MANSSATFEHNKTVIIVSMEDGYAIPRYLSELNVRSGTFNKTFEF